MLVILKRDMLYTIKRGGDINQCSMLYEVILAVVD
jgi:hypothetical protein